MLLTSIRRSLSVTVITLIATTGTFTLRYMFLVKASPNFPQRSLSKDNVSPVRSVLVKSPTGSNLSDAGASVSLPGGKTYKIQVEFKDESGNEYPRHPHKYRRIYLYQWSGNSKMNCKTSLCWSYLKQFSTQGSVREETIAVDRDTKWLITSWHSASPCRLTIIGGYPDCPMADCYKVEEIQEGRKKGLRIEFEFDPPKTDCLGPTTENLRVAARGKTRIIILPAS
jgi:hypothetical protein